jgi:hypothetical protein
MLLSIHIIGDFYLQSPKTAEEKNSSLKSLLKHIGIYICVGLISAALVFSKFTTIAIVIVVFSHAVIDYIKKVVVSNFKQTETSKTTYDTVIFVADQAAHIAVIFIVSCLFVAWGGEVKLLKFIINAANNLGIDIKQFARWIISFLIVCKPTNIALKAVIGKYNPKITGISENSSKTNAGAFIGSIERILILIFLAIGEYASVGLIFAAKSIIRFSEMSKGKDKDLADYYIIGTLASLLSAIIVFYVLLRC